MPKDALQQVQECFTEVVGRLGLKEVPTIGPALDGWEDDKPALLVDPWGVFIVQEMIPVRRNPTLLQPAVYVETLGWRAYALVTDYSPGEPETQDYKMIAEGEHVGSIVREVILAYFEELVRCFLGDWEQYQNYLEGKEYAESQE